MKKIIYLLIVSFFALQSFGQTIQSSGSLSFCPGGSVELTVSPTTGITGYQWINGTTNVGSNIPSYIANTSGSYTVKLTRTSLPDITIGPVVVTVNPLPTVSVNSPSICIGSSTTLTASGADTYTWSPPGGLSATSGVSVTANPTVTTSYTVTGKNTVTGCSNTAIAIVTVNPLPPVPSFTVATSGQCADIPFAFNVASPVTGTTYTWDFGDGSALVTGINVLHTFNSAIGNGSSPFNVTVKATTASNCSVTSAVQIVSVKQKPDPKLFEQNNFRFCGNIGSVALNVTDVSTPPTNTNYEINWGDGSGNYLSGVPPSSEPHSYSTGIYSLTYNVTGTNGCKGTRIINVLNITNPRVGAGIPANASGCGPLTICFPINETRDNHSSTIYKVDFGDGSQILTFPQPPPDSVCHTYIRTSCGDPGSRFSFQIQAINGCDTSYGNFAPIRVFTKPIASFTVGRNPSCINSLVNFSNTSIFGYNNSCSISATYKWDFGDGSPAITVFDNSPQTHTYNTSGTYQVKLIAQNTCDTSSFTLPVCIEDKPLPSFTLSDLSGCIPFLVNVNNSTTISNSCQPLKYRWLVDYAPAFCGNSPAFTYVNVSSDTSSNPSFSFTNPGTYTIRQNVSNSCGNFETTKVVNVKKPPTVTITPLSYPCGPITITPVANVTACGTGSLTYKWTFAGGLPDTSNLLNPGPVSFSGVGSHTITLAVTNECGKTTATETVIVTAAPDVVVPANQSKCGGETVGPLTFSSTVGTPTYRWTNDNPSIGLAASGQGNIGSFSAINNGTVPVTATITVTPFVSTACSGPTASFTITVNPRPAAPVVITPVIYCLNTTAAPLSGTATTGNTLTWYNNIALTGGTAIAPIPSTSTQGTFLFYVTQTNSFVCASPATAITVTVNPSISGNTVTADQNICANTIPTALTTLNIVGGGSGSYIYQWQSSIDSGITWTNIPGSNNPTYSPPALSVTIKYRRIINSSTCSDTSNIVTITVQGALANYNITASQVICEGLAPLLLTGGLPTGGGGSYTYLWEFSTDNITWTTTGNTDQNYQPAALLQTTYFRRKVSASQCNAVSNVDTITVNPTPNGVIDVANPSICEYDAASIIFTATSGSGPFNIDLKITGPGGFDTTITQTINNNGPVTISVLPANSAPGIYTIVLTKITDSKTCVRTGDISMVTITIKPRPILTTSTAPTICSGNTAPLTVSGADDYLWSPSSGLSSTTGNSVIANPAITTTYTITGTLNGCVSTTNLTVTVTPGATPAATGPAQVLCNVPGAILSANAAVIGTGSWKQLSGPDVTITDSSQTNTTVTGLTGGQRYIFTWTINGLPPCPATSANDTIDVLSPIINVIKNDTVICSGQSVLLQTQDLSGGSTNGLAAEYTYQWESASPGQTNWQLIPGATGDTLLISPTVSTCYRRRVKSNSSCETISNPVCVTVNPQIGNNTISTTQERCVNTIPGILTGAVPTGGDNNYIYQWQTGIDGINWTDIGSDINYQPVAYPLAGIHYFRRNVTGGNCVSSSNIITITVRPDSKAIFSANPAIDCAPFDLATAIIITALPDSNDLYQWYANDSLFGSNTTGIFPGYVIQNPADTVLIKLTTTSQYGCKPDSIQQQFVTVITARAQFTKGTSFGCGPLPVTFTNTSNILNGIQFSWDFGNGETSGLTQPATVNFNSSPFFNDTTYQVSLKAYNGCDTTIWRDSVKVRANPKARFGVDTTFGCSPFTIQVNNTSPGGPNTYYWDFGNGSRDTTSANGVFNYTYNIGNAVDTFTIRLIAENECRRDTQSINIRVAPNPIRPLINVNSSELFGCAPHIVSFNNNTSGATEYTWRFGDNTAPVITNNNQNTVVHRYDSAGVFTVAIDITNGCSDTTVFRQVTVYAGPVAAFTTNAAIFCVGDTVKVTNTSKDATNYRWFWGDGTNSTEPDPYHVFRVSGNYNILLRAERTNSTGLVCFDTLVRPVAVLAKPDVTVRSNINEINCAPFTLNISAPGIINENVTWYFYDSTVTPSIITSNGISAQYTFNKPGSYYVKMVAVNAAGCTDSTIVRFRVRGKAVASFTPGDLAVCTRDTTVNYINTSTYNGTDPISYQWLVDNVLISRDANFVHRYNVLPAALLPRIFTTSLVVSNNVGCSDTASATLQMNPVARAQFSITNLNECVPFKPIIVNASEYTSSYRWLLNGAFVSNNTDPGIVITQGSTRYTISLIADNIYGCKPDTFSVTFTSRARPAASFRLSDTLGCTGVLNVGTTNLTTGASTYIWNWGDGTANSFFNNPTHLYGTPGQYLVTLVASDGVCTDTTEQLVKVSNKPNVDFSVDQTQTCDTARVQFINNTTNATTYLWSFGDGTFSNAPNPSKSYTPRAAPYTIKLVASSTFGCKDSVVKANLVLAKVPPASDFFISPSPVITVPNYTFNFNNLTLNSVNYKYLWSLGDGSFAATRDITHKYADTGNYSVRLIVLDTASNCSDTTTKIARIDGFPGYLYVPNAICPACIQTNVREFLPKGAGLKEYRLQIFTTWNELIFETSVLDSKGTPTQAWDGKFKGTIVQQDVYVWRIDAKFLNGSEWLGMIYPGDSKYKKVGTITVIK